MTEEFLEMGDVKRVRVVDDDDEHGREVLRRLEVQDAVEDGEIHVVAWDDDVEGGDLNDRWVQAVGDASYSVTKGTERPRSTLRGANQAAIMGA